MRLPSLKKTGVCMLLIGLLATVVIPPLSILILHERITDGWNNPAIYCAMGGAIAVIVAVFVLTTWISITVWQNNKRYASIAAVGIFIVVTGLSLSPVLAYLPYAISKTIALAPADRISFITNTAIASAIILLVSFITAFLVPSGRRFL